MAQDDEKEALDQEKNFNLLLKFIFSRRKGIGNWVKDQWASKRKNTFSQEREEKFLAAEFDFIAKKGSYQRKK